MGNIQGKCKSNRKGDIIPSVVSISQRENMATWHRTDVALTDVYDIMDTLGNGHMGEVYKVVKKVETRGLHNAETRQKASTSYIAEDQDASVRSFMDNESDRSRIFGTAKKLQRGSDHSLGSTGSFRSFSSPFLSRKRRVEKKNEETLKEIQRKEQQTLGSGALNHLKPISPVPILRNPSHDLKAHIDPIEVDHVICCSADGAVDSEIASDNDDDSFPLDTATTSTIYDSSTEKKPNIEKQCSTIIGARPVICCSGDNVVDSDDENTLAFDDSSTARKGKRDLHAHFVEDSEHEGSSASGDKVSTAMEGLGFNWGGNHEVVDEIEQGTKKKWVPRRKIRFQRLYACKTIATEKIKEGKLHELLNEIYMMRKMDHPYIIRLYEVYQVKRKLWLVMDLCQGGDLTSRKLNEPQVVVVAEQILRGVAYLHRRGICHRDLKQENILYEDNSSKSSIRLIDFGLTKSYDATSNKGEMGAAYCLSPELASGTAPYTDKSDVWSIGVIIWIQLAGDYPFLRQATDLKDEAKLKKLVDANHTFGITWKGRGITEHAKIFVRGCLKKDPKDRWSAIQALAYLQDEWIAHLQEKEKIDNELIKERLAATPTSKIKRRTNMDIAIDDEPSSVLDNTFSSKNKKDKNIFDSQILSSIKRYVSYSLLKKTVLITVANMMDRKDAYHLSEIFLLVDTEQTGTISHDELKKALTKMHVRDLESLSDEEIENIFSGIDHDQSGQIHFAEFLAALAEGAGMVTMESLSDAFDRIDGEGKGYISHMDLQKILGKNYSKDVADKMIEEGDLKKNGLVDYDEFVQLMTQD